MDMKDSKSRSSTSTARICVNISILNKLKEISIIENLPTSSVLEKLIMNYTPVPATLQEGEFQTIPIWQIRNVRKLKPTVIIVSVFWNKQIGMPYKTWLEWKNKRMTWEEFRRKYIERLMLPDAQEEIKRLRKLKQSNNIYITSWEKDEEHSMRKIFVDFVNGKLVWI